jgi:ferrochelatase
MLNGTPSVSEQIGVLVMAYGTPATLADVETYYTHIRRGRPPEAAQLRELIGRYQAIGGSSPLLEISRAQATGLQTQLEAKHGGHFQVELGMKHAPPFIEDGVQRLIDAAVQCAVGIVLAPHYSPLSVGEYLARARNAAGEALDLSFVEDWHLASSYIDLLAERVSESLSCFPVEIRDEVDVVFTAHSLPARVLRSDDPYPQQLRETAEAVASTIDLAHFSIAWQSAGRTSEPWLRPDILEVTHELAAAGSKGMIVCPAGFVSDHLEILYDLDVECRALAANAGLPWQRTSSPNADPVFLEALCDVVIDRLAMVAK